MTFLYSVPGPWHMFGSSGSDLLRPSILLNSGAPFAFVWTSAMFFPELLRRRVGWAGSLIWACLQTGIFALGLFSNLFQVA